ncbi:MAG: isoprenylcysteine carboxylmethyltransferase family protein [Pseudomonadota bacterium]
MVVAPPPPLIGLTIAVFMGFIAKWTPDLSTDQSIVKGFGVAIMAAGLLIELICIAAFFRSKTTVNPFTPQKTSSLVTTGLYRISRNPMYLGMAALLTGWAAFLGSAAALLGPLLFVVTITLVQIKPEEKALAGLFGEDYEAYRRKTRRWI